MNLFTETPRKEKSLEELWDQFKTRMKIADDYKRKHGLFGTAPSQSWQDQQVLLDQIKKQQI